MAWPLKHHLSVYLVMGIEEGKDPLWLAEEAIEGGVTMLQLREKKAPLKKVLEIGKGLRDICKKRGIPFIVNDRADVALLLEADGLHVGQDDIPYSEARRLLGPDKIIGVSAGNMEEAEAAVKDGADYLGVGSVYPTRTKQDAGAPVGPSLLEDIRKKWDVPMVGIGGIHADNAIQVIQAGADGVAVVSAITLHENPRLAASLLRKKVDYAKSLQLGRIH